LILPIKKSTCKNAKKCIRTLDLDKKCDRTKNKGHMIGMSNREEGYQHGCIDKKKSAKMTSLMKSYQLRKKWLGLEKKLGMVKIIGSINHQT